MKRTVFGLLAATVLASGAGAGETPLLPKGPPPTFGVVSMKGDRLLLRLAHLVPETRPERRVVPVQQNGKIVMVEEIIHVTVLKAVFAEQDISGAQIYGVNGKPYDATRLREVLKKATVALISADGNPIDPAYLQAAREGTLVIVTPRRGANVPVPLPVPVPPPAPAPPPKQ